MTRQPHTFVREAKRGLLPARIAGLLVGCGLLVAAPPKAHGSQAADTGFAPPLAQSQSSGRETAVSVAFGVAAVGVAVSGASAALMLVKRSELRDECGSLRTCPPSARDEVDAYHRYGTISAVSLGVGAAGALTGISLLLLGTDDEDESSTTRRPVAVVSPAFVGVKGRF